MPVRGRGEGRFLTFLAGKPLWIWRGEGERVLGVKVPGKKFKVS